MFIQFQPAFFLATIPVANITNHYTSGYSGWVDTSEFFTHCLFLLPKLQHGGNAF